MRNCKRGSPIDDAIFLCSLAVYLGQDVALLISKLFIDYRKEKYGNLTLFYQLNLIWNLLF